MAFPISPVDGQQNIVGNVTYQYSSADNSWTRIGGQVPTLSIAGNVSAGNIYSLGPVSAVGNVTGNYIIGNGSQLTGLPAGYSNADVANYLASGTDTLDIITTGNIVGGNIVTAGTGGNISGANFILGNVVSASGNVTGDYILGNGSQLTGLPAGYANANAAAYFASGTSSSNISITGNLLTTSYVSATGNITGDYILGNGALLTGVITSVANINNGTSNVTVTSSGGDITVGVSGVGNVAVFTPTGLSVTGAITATGNIVGGGVRTTTSATAPTSPAPAVGDMWFNTTDNATYRYTYDGTSYFWEDFTGGSITANTSGIVNGTSNVSVAANSNVTVGVTGTTRATFASDALYITGNILPTSNNVFSLGSPTAQWASVYLSANTLYLGSTPLSANTTSNTLTIGGNTVVTADPTGTSSTTGNVQVVGNVTGSNLLSDGVVSATGNIRGSNINTVGLVSATGNVIGGNVLFGSGQVSGTGSVYATAFVGSLTGTASVAVSALGTAATVTTAAQPNITSVGTLTSVTSTGLISTTGNVVGASILGTTVSVSGNVLTGAVSATGNIISGNVLTGAVSATGITVGGTATLPGTATAFASRVTNIAESANIIASAPSATTNFYINNGAVQYYTANATANITLNFAFSSTTSLNSAMAVGDSVSTTFMMTNGATAYLPTVFQVDSTNVTPKWQGGTAPSSGDASALDIYNFVIIKTASATYAVLGSQTKFA